MKNYQKPAVIVEKFEPTSVVRAACTQKSSEQIPFPAGGVGIVFTDETTLGTCTATIEAYNEAHPTTPICYHAPSETYGLFES